MEFYLTALMRGKRGEEKCSVFLFSTGEQGRDVFNTRTWEKKRRREENSSGKIKMMMRHLTNT